MTELSVIAHQPERDYNLDEIDRLAGIILAATGEIRRTEGEAS